MAPLTAKQFVSYLEEHACLYELLLEHFIGIKEAVKECDSCVGRTSCVDASEDDLQPASRVEEVFNSGARLPVARYVAYFVRCCFQQQF